MNKYFRRTARPPFKRQVDRMPVAAPPPKPHVERREGDEIACSCGARWPVGEDHP